MTYTQLSSPTHLAPRKNKTPRNHDTQHPFVHEEGGQVLDIHPNLAAKASHFSSPRRLVSQWHGFNEPHLMVNPWLVNIIW